MLREQGSHLGAQVLPVNFVANHIQHHLQAICSFLSHHDVVLIYLYLLELSVHSEKIILAENDLEKGVAIADIEMAQLVQILRTDLVS